MKRAICLMTLVGGALFAGCGGGGDSTPETPITPTTQAPPKLSKAEYIRQADSYCAELNAALGATSDSTTGSPAGVEPRADLYQGLLNHLHGLGTPDDDAGLDEFLSAGDEVVAAEKTVETAQAEGDSTALAQAEADAASAEGRFADAAQSYGFEECGQGPSAPSGTATAPATAPPVAPAAPTATPTTPTPVAPAPSGGAGATTGTGTGGGTGGGSTGTGGGTGGTSGSGGVGPG